MKPVDRLGVTYGRLTVVALSGLDKYGRRRWKCLCLCGVAVVVASGNLGSGNTVSCGCLPAEGNCYRHGHALKGAPSKTYRAWASMRKRCTNPNDKAWKYYGGCGISVDLAWEDFAVFLSDMGECPPGLTLDRKDVNGNYSKDNCRWATRTDQARNKTTTINVTRNGKTKCLKEWCTELGLSYSKVHMRVNGLGWSIEEALTP